MNSGRDKQKVNVQKGFNNAHRRLKIAIEQVDKDGSNNSSQIQQNQSLWTHKDSFRSMFKSPSQNSSKLINTL